MIAWHGRLAKWGRVDIRQAAALRAREIPADHRPYHIDAAIDRDLRTLLPIGLLPLAWAPQSGHLVIWLRRLLWDHSRTL